MSSRKLGNIETVEAQKMRDAGLFYREIAAALGVSYSMARRMVNPKVREQDRIYGRDWTRNHKKERRVYNAAYSKDHKKAKCAYDKARHKDHKKKRNAQAAAYGKNHRAGRAARQAVRNALILGATVGNIAEIKEIYRKAHDDKRVRCYLCGKLIPKGHRHVDHIMPLSRGGPHRPSNLAVACDKCNHEKYDKLPETVGILL